MWYKTNCDRFTSNQLSFIFAFRNYIYEWGHYHERENKIDAVFNEHEPHFLIDQCNAIYNNNNDDDDDDERLVVINNLGVRGEFSSLIVVRSLQLNLFIISLHIRGIFSHSIASPRKLLVFSNIDIEFYGWKILNYFIAIGDLAFSFSTVDQHVIMTIFEASSYLCIVQSLGTSRCNYFFWQKCAKMII